MRESRWYLSIIFIVNYEYIKHIGYYNIIKFECILAFHG